MNIETMDMMDNERCTIHEIARCTICIPAESVTDGMTFGDHLLITTDDDFDAELIQCAAGMVDTHLKGISE